MADVYDALTSERIYKKAITHEKAKEIITHAKGKHFDPDVVDSFITREEDFKMIWEIMHNEDYYMWCGILKWQPSRFSLKKLLRKHL